MRQIKFRAWDFEIRKMIDHISLSPRIDEAIYGWGNNDVATSLYLMQYTGLKDKNGKEIYEGDIVDWDGDQFEIKYGIQLVDAFEGIGFNLWSFYGRSEDIGKAIRLQSAIEVIGNIYENPELLKNHEA